MALGDSFLQLEREGFVALKATIVHGKNLANPSYGLLCRARKPHHKVVRVKRFQFSDGVYSKEYEGFTCLRIV